MYSIYAYNTEQYFYNIVCACVCIPASCYPIKANLYLSHREQTEENKREVAIITVFAEGEDGDYCLLYYFRFMFSKVSQFHIDGLPISSVK
jgi:hypothetical protein